MEGGVHRERLNQKTSVGTVLLLMCMFTSTLTQLQSSGKQTCPDGDYQAGNGICCNKCSPGFRLANVCYASNQRSNCTPCPPSQYIEQMNFSPNCRSCKVCRDKKHEVQVSPCERYRNTICRCEDGYYKSNVDSETYECRRCSKCGTDEKEQDKCTPEKNTVCQCKDGYHKVNFKCEPCKECKDDCKHLCPLSVNTGDPGDKQFAQIIGVTATVAIVICGIFIAVTYFGTKKSMKDKLKKSSSETSTDSQDSCERGLIINEHPNSNVEAIPQSSLNVSEPSSPPDCPHLEIKISDLIYTVLDQVPVPYVKRLMRSLGVRDIDIEHAELDYRPSREVHYQILRMWAERGSHAGGRGGTGTLQEPLIEELLNKLREMDLGRAAEELETKYGIH